MNQEKIDKLAWINWWRSIDPVIRAQSRKELQTLSQRERQQQIANLLELAFEFRKPRLDNGLVILQKKLLEMFKP